MNYSQLTSEERYTISGLRKAGMNNAQIARQMGRHRSTIWREVTRNDSRRKPGVYHPHRAIEKTSARRRKSRRNRRYGPNDWRQVVRLLKEDWSPEQIAGWLRDNGGPRISHETIYLYLWRDKHAGGHLYLHLRQAGKQKRKRYGTYESRGRLPGKRHISERPKYVAKRKSLGHWEIDTVVGVGSKDCVTTLVERHSGFAMIGKLPDRTQAQMTRRTKKLIRRTPHAFKTITSDNGTEFHDYKSVEKATGVTYYFATPYHSWQRGSNENFNGLLRQYLPKRASMAHLTQAQCNALARKLNTRPRKRLGFKTPEEVFYASVALQT